MPARRDEVERDGLPGAGSQKRRKTPLAIGVVSEGMLVRRMSVAAPDVVFVKGILEASEGVAALFAESGGELSIVAPNDRAVELDALLSDLRRDLEVPRA